MGKASKTSAPGWSLTSKAVTTGAVGASKFVLDKGWRAATGRKPPTHGADPDVNVWEAVTWAAVAGASVALARLMAQRKAAEYYLRSTGNKPPIKPL